jgi:hypothetical protein
MVSDHAFCPFHMILSRIYTMFHTYSIHFSARKDICIRKPFKVSLLKRVIGFADICEVSYSSISFFLKYLSIYPYWNIWDSSARKNGYINKPLKSVPIKKGNWFYCISKVFYLKVSLLFAWMCELEIFIIDSFEKCTSIKYEHISCLETIYTKWQCTE